MADDQHPHRPPFVLAMERNDKGALCIEKGQYQLAILILLDALRLSKEDELEESCLSECSELDEWAIFNRRPKPQQEDKNIIATSAPPHSCTNEANLSSMVSDQKIEQRHCVVHQENNKKEYIEEEDDEERGFVYKQPIRMSPTATEEEHPPRTVLSIIIVFNLGLAHHLNACDMQQRLERRQKQQQLQITRYKNNYYNTSKEGTARGLNPKRYLRKAFHLYQTSFRFHYECDTISFEFLLILINNLGQIHKAMNNPEKHQLCLEKSVSIMMFLMDSCDSSMNTTTSTALDRDSASTQNYTDHEEEELSSFHGLPCKDGFIRNVTPIILQGNVAGAA